MYAIRSYYVLADGPLAIVGTSLRLKSGTLVLRDGRAVENLTLSLDSTFDRLTLNEIKSREALRAVSADISVAGRVPDLRFLKGYFRQTPWLKLDGAGQMEADVRVKKGVITSYSIHYTKLYERPEGSARER